MLHTAVLRELMASELTGCALASEYLPDPGGVLLLSAEEPVETDCVYVGAPELFARLYRDGRVPGGATVFLAGCPAMPQGDFGLVNLYASALGLAALHNRLCRIFRRAAALGEALRVHMVGGVTAVVRAAGKLLGGPVHMLSSDWEPIPGMSEREDDSTLRIATGEAHQLDSQFVYEHFPQAEGARAPVLRAAEDGRFFLARVQLNDKLSIYLLGLAECGPEDGFLLMQQLLRLVERMLRSDQSQLLLERLDFASVMQDLSADEEPDFDTLNLRISRLRKKPDTFMRLLLIRPAADSRAVLRECLRRVQKLFRGDNVAVCGRDVVVQISAPVNNFAPDFDTAALEEMLQDYDAWAIISNPSVRARGLRVFYFQCAHTIKLTAALHYQTRQRCFFYNQFSIYHVVDTCAHFIEQLDRSSDIIYLCHPGVLMLTRYDRTYNNNLRDVLFCYLLNDRSIAKTSKQLYLHRNTTIYKLGKITEMIGADLESGYVRFQLLFSCMVIRYRELYQQVDIPLDPFDRSSSPGFQKESEDAGAPV